MKEQGILSLLTEVAFALYDFIQTTIAHKLGVALDIEKLESISPVLFRLTGAASLPSVLPLRCLVSR